jgi:hypothetical protein
MDLLVEINKIRDHDDELFEIFKCVMPLTLKLITNSKIKKTSELFIMFITSTNFIKNSIFDSIENDDVYSSKILLRSLIEHFLRFKFILINHTLEKNDKKSEYYFTILEISEYLTYSKAVKSIKHIYAKDEDTLDEMWDELCIKFPRLKSYPRKEIEEFNRNFSIKNIIRFLTRKVINIEKNKDIFLSTMILEYSDLSSFVHGGISAYKSSFEYSEVNNREKEQLRIGELAFKLCGAIKQFSYLIFFQHDKEFGPYYLKTEEILKKV